MVFSEAPSLWLRRQIWNLGILVSLLATAGWAAADPHAADSKASVASPATHQVSWRQFHFSANGTRLNPKETVLSPQTVSGLRLKWTYTSVAHGSWDNNLYALNAKTGAKLWSFPTGGIVNYSSPAVVNGMVYVGSWDNNLYALNAKTGAKLWSFPTGSYIDSSPAVANDVVYIGSADRNLYALNANTGATLWSFNTQPGQVDTSPTVVNGVVYFTSGYCLYAVNANTGALLWTYTGSGLANSSPTVANGVVYFGADDYNTYDRGQYRRRVVDVLHRRVHRRFQSRGSTGSRLHRHPRF